HGRTLLSIGALAALAACSPDSPTSSSIIGPSSVLNSASANGQAHRAARVCPTSAVAEARCHSWVIVDDAGNPLATTGPSGYGPADLQSAYALAGATGTGTIAIVDAYDDPNAENDMN